MSDRLRQLAKEAPAAPPRSENEAVDVAALEQQSPQHRYGGSNPVHDARPHDVEHDCVGMSGCGYGGALTIDVEVVWMCRMASRAGLSIKK
ncbi:hypothetical protein [Bradyrhizobium sp. USDA 4529]